MSCRYLIFQLFLNPNDLNEHERADDDQNTPEQVQRVLIVHVMSRDTIKYVNMSSVF